MLDNLLDMREDFAFTADQHPARNSMVKYFFEVHVPTRERQQRAVRYPYPNIPFPPLCNTGSCSCSAYIVIAETLQGSAASGRHVLFINRNKRVTWTLQGILTPSASCRKRCLTSSPGTRSCFLTNSLRLPPAAYSSII